MSAFCHRQVLHREREVGRGLRRCLRRRQKQKTAATPAEGSAEPQDEAAEAMDEAAAPGEEPATTKEEVAPC